MLHYSATHQTVLIATNLNTISATKHIKRNDKIKLNTFSLEYL